ncbi:hypothetical protein FRC19_001191 [Serendipita sp. 401]|nr:hypothetical protein FRC19_001191 [Serendipita sp. 401]
MRQLDSPCILALGSFHPRPINVSSLSVMAKSQKVETRLIHADHEFADDHIGPAISVSTTFRYPEIGRGEWRHVATGWDNLRPNRHFYSRETVATSTRVETILGDLHGGYALIYSSGSAAAFSVLVHLGPKRIALRDGYSGFHHIVGDYRRINPNLKVIDLDDELCSGDLIWLETPLNPTGEVRDIVHYVRKAHAAGAKIAIDATLAPPPLQNPFKCGADVIVHSASKYIGGHSDVLAGVAVVRSEEAWRDLWNIRLNLGNNAGSLESWLLLRSLRTFSLRISKQSKNATQLATWLDQISKTPRGKTFDGTPGGTIRRVWHGSLQSKKKFDPTVQHEGGFSATFGILMENAFYAQRLPESFKLITHATSLGGVETLIEHRIHSDEKDDARLLRISVGIEDIEDLKADFRLGLNAIFYFG